MAIKLARALRKEGVFRTYALAGGFAAWGAADLPIEKGNSNYDVNPLEALTEEAEALLQSTQESIVNAPVWGSVVGRVVKHHDHHYHLM